MSAAIQTSQGLVWCGPVFDPSGYADEGRGMLCALEQRGVPVTLRPLRRHVAGFREGLLGTERSMLDRQIARALPERQVLVQHHTADGFVHMAGDVHLVGRTMFETDSVPASWVGYCNQMDELWLPSQFNTETFRRAGVHVPIVRVPGGIDSTVFRPDVRPMPVAGLRGTIFLSVFEWRRGKGWDVLLKAWADAFAPDADVTLVLRTYPVSGSSGLDNEAVINARIDTFLAEACGRTRRDVAPIVVLGKTVPAAQMPALYRIADVLVAPTRGEGWGRPFMEAMASGVPVVATRWSAHLEFMNDGNSLLLDIDGTEPADGIEIASYREQRWAAPSAAHLTTLLRRAHEDPEGRRALGARARSDMVEQWPWSRAANAITERLQEVRDRDALVHVPRASTSGPGLLVDALLFDARCGETPLDRVMGHLLSQWRGAVAVRTRSSGTRRPSNSTVTHTAWRAMASNTSALDAMDIALSWLDATQPWPLTRPRCSHWAVHTGDVVSRRVPPALVRTLRDHADEVWVPTEEARIALLEVGVTPDRIWLTPVPSAPPHVTANGPRLPLPRRADTVFLLPALDVEQADRIDLILRTWQRTFDRSRSALLLLYAPETQEPAVHAWHERLLALLGTGRLLLGAPIQIKRDRLATDDLAALVRTADVVLDPFPTPRTLPIVRLAQATHRTLISSDPASDWCVPEQLTGMAAVTAWRTALATAAVPMAAQPNREAVDSDPSLPTDEQCAAAVFDRLVTQCRALTRRHVELVTRPTTLPFTLAEARRTTFLAMVDWHDGTGEGIVQAFIRAFDVRDDVTLVLCLDPVQGVGAESVGALVANAMRMAGQIEGAAADVVLVPDVLTTEVRQSLIARCDVVVAVQDELLARAAEDSERIVLASLAPAAWRSALARASARSSATLSR